MNSSQPARHRRRIWVILGLAVAILLTGLTWALRPSQRTANTPTSVTAQPADDDIRTGLTRFPAGRRPPAPDAAGTSLDGRPLSLRALRGHIVVVNVWGSWCAPCRQEAPDLARLARQTHSQGVRFIGIDTRDTPTAARAFTRHYAIPYPSIDDRQGRALLAFTGIIPVNAVPSTLVLDPHGRPAARVVGRVTFRTLAGLLHDLRTESNQQERTRKQP